jgi:putative flippase GtrA
MKNLSRVGSFIVVGGAAAAVHLGVVVLLVSRSGLAPLAANIGGWLVAFCVSFLGQWQLTFRSQAAPPLRALRRFLLLSAAGFVANETAFAMLLQVSLLPYPAALAIVIAGVAVMTYLLSLRWAFVGGARG